MLLAGGFEVEGRLPLMTCTEAHVASGVVVLARDAKTGTPAGGGLCVAPHEGVTELTSIGVAEAFRRRGIAAALAGWLAQAALDRGLSVFLMAAGPEEARIYARRGLRRAGRGPAHFVQRGTKSIVTGTPSSSKRSRTWFSTQYP